MIATDEGSIPLEEMVGELSSEMRKGSAKYGLARGVEIGSDGSSEMVLMLKYEPRLSLPSAGVERLEELGEPDCVFGAAAAFLRLRDANRPKGFSLEDEDRRLEDVDCLIEAASSFSRCSLAALFLALCSPTHFLSGSVQITSNMIAACLIRQ